MSVQKYRWYLDDQGDEYSQKLFMSLLKSSSFCQPMMCEDGATRKLWRCSGFNVMATLAQECVVKGYSCKGYVSEGNSNPRPWIGERPDNKNIGHVQRSAKLRSAPYFK